MTLTNRVPTAPLFVPGDRPERFSKAARSGADAVIIDLEDAVAPERKVSARANLRLADSGAPVYVRVNGAATPWHRDDLRAAGAIQCAGILLPKAESPDDLAAVRELLPDAPVLLLMESARGLAAVRSLAQLPQVRALIFGSLDYCADLGCRHLRELLLPVRLEIALAARLAGLPGPLDGVTADLSDPTIAEDDARHAADLGFAGKLCIHPNQVVPVRRAFRPTPKEIDWARAVIALDRSAATLEGMMIDAPVRLRAQQILQLAEFD